MVTNGHERLPAIPSLIAPSSVTQAGYEQARAGLVLCITDNVPAARRELVPVLEGAGFDVDLSETTPRKLGELASRPYCMVLFDVGARSDSSYQMCIQTRAVSELPIMLLLRGTARNEVLRGYEAGADAYVLVPFDARELLARMSALLRRQSARHSIA